MDLEMTAPGRALLARCAAVWAGATAGASGLTAWVLPVLRGAHAALTTGDLDHQRFDRVLVWICATIVLAGGAWLWLVASAVALEALRGGGCRLPGVPGAVRRLLLAACGAAVAGGLSAALHGPAQATPGDVHTDRVHGPQASLVAGLPLPDRPSSAVAGGARIGTGALAPAGEQASRPVRDPAPDTVVVQAGDTLWDLARRHLGHHAADALVAQRWQEIYALNRAVVGPDPDLIRPAQRLRLPR